MNKIKEWILNNKLSSVLILILVFVFGRGLLSNVLSLGRSYNMVSSDMAFEMAAPSMGSVGSKVGTYRPTPVGGSAPRLDVEERMVVTNSNLSLHVKDVKASINSIKGMTTDMGGFMVDSSMTTPEGATNGNITIRVPSEKLDGMLEYLRGLAVKVVSESITGTDVTDQYMDIEERLRTYELTKAKYETILDSATDVDDILTITERIISVQNSIDSLKGQMFYLEKTSSSSLITIYLSTDELELPYAPDQPWRPEVVFKYAVRSMITSLRKIANVLIWAAVYAPLVLIGWLIIKFFVNWKKRKDLTKSQA